MMGEACREGNMGGKGKWVMGVMNFGEGGREVTVGEVCLRERWRGGKFIESQGRGREGRGEIVPCVDSPCY